MAKIDGRVPIIASLAFREFYGYQSGHMNVDLYISLGPLEICSFFFDILLCNS